MDQYSEYCGISSEYSHIPKIKLLNEIREQIRTLQEQLYRQEELFRAIELLPDDAIKSEEELERVRHYIATGGEVVTFSPIGEDGQDAEAFTVEEMAHLNNREEE